MEQQRVLAATRVDVAPAPLAEGLEPDDSGARSRWDIRARSAAFAKNWRGPFGAEGSGGLTGRDLRRLLGMFLLSRAVILSVSGALQFGGKDDPIRGLQRWDTGWYMKVAEFGYPKPAPGEQSATAFFPAWPFTLKVVHHLGMQGWDFNGPAFGRVAFLVANVCAFVALIAACAYLRTTRGPDYNYTTFAALFLFAPFSFYFATILSEPMFVMFVAITFWASSRHRYLLAGLAVAGAGATRSTGLILVIVPIAFSYLEVAGRPSLRAIGPYLRRVIRWPRLLVGLAIAPMGVVAYVAYLWVHLGDPLIFLKAESSWSHTSANPVVTLLKVATFRGPGGDGYAPAEDFLYLMIILVAAWVLMKTHRGTWLAEVPLAAALILIVLDSPVANGPLLQSVQRYLAGILVVYFAAADLLNRWTSYRQVAITCLIVVELWLITLWVTYATMFVG